MTDGHSRYASSECGLKTPSISRRPRRTPTALGSARSLRLKSSSQKNPSQYCDTAPYSSCFRTFRVSIHTTKKLCVDRQPDKKSTDSGRNVNGGAIALGHPIGMTGARLALTLALELRRRGGGTGAAALCGGGGQGEAIILRAPGA